MSDQQFGNWGAATQRTPGQRRRSIEPDPQTWWPRYGHRLEPRIEESGVVNPSWSPDPDRPPRQHLDPDPARPDPADALLDQPAPSDAWTTSSGGLNTDSIVRARPDEPASGWRRRVLQATSGLINPGPGPAELRLRAVTHRIRRPLSLPYRVAVASIKGGVGKTTVSALLGLVMAEHRGDRVIALDANPDAGTLADRLTGESAVTVRELLRDLDRIHSWTEVSRYASLTGRLQVLASEQDPAASDALGLSRAEYQDICVLLDRFFNIVVTDSGTGLVHSAMAGTLALASSIIVVGAPTVDGAGRASKTLDWLQAHGHGELAADAIAVLSCDRSSPEVDRTRIREHFTTRCRAVIEIPHDPHLASGGRIELSRLRPATRDAAYELAALIADRFS